MPHADVNEKGNNPCHKANYAHKDPAHDLSVQVRLWRKGGDGYLLIFSECFEANSRKYPFAEAS